MSNPLVLVTVSGPDAPGITSSLTGLLAQSDATIHDVGQAVIHGLLSLSFVIELPGSGQTVIKELLFKATELGLKLEFRALAKSAHQAASAPRQRYAVTLIADPVSARAIHEVTAVLARQGLNIDRIDRLSEGSVACIELIVSSAAASPVLSPTAEEALRKALFDVAKQQSVDIAVQTDGVHRRAKRLIVFDMDSTLIQSEVIDELARAHGVYDEVATLTERAMNGEFDYDQSLRNRVKLLKGLPESTIDEVFEQIQLTPGASEIVSALRHLGYKTAVISGSFGCVAKQLQKRLGLDYAYANELEIKDGKATGTVTPPIVNAQRKADLLELIAQQEKIPLTQVIAIGDGANDVLMLEKAGLGIAFNAKPAVRARARFSINQKNLQAVLYLLGIPARDLPDLVE